MLVIQITLDFFTHGGLMKRSRQETLALLKAGHSVIIITDLRWTSHMYQFKEYKDKLRIIPIKPFYLYRLRNISRQLSFTFKTYYALKNLANKEKIELIVTHLPVSCYAVAPLAKKLKIPSVLVMQDIIRDRIATGNPYNWWETQLFKHSNLFAFKKMDFIIVVSKYNKKLVLMDGAKPENTFIKYNAVDTELFTPNKDIKKDIDILFIGRLSIEKGIDILIDSTKFLHKRRKILIIGEGPLREKLQLQAKKINKHKFHFEGFVNPQLLPQYIRRAKVVVTPSRSECQASVPLEAMACGIPVVASRVSGMEDSIQHNKNGWLLEENSPSYLGNLLERILDNEEELNRIGIAAHKRAENFSQQKFFDEIIKFYETLIRKFNLSS